MIFAIRNNGSANAAAYEAISTTFTDITNHWAAGYIKYLQNYGIVAGKSEIVFAPNAAVTTGEVYKMALVLGGYRADKAELTGAKWLDNTTSLAQQNQLDKNVNSGLRDGCTRQDAAQILANTLGMTATVWSEFSYGFENDSDDLTNKSPITVGYKWMGLKDDTLAALDASNKDITPDLDFKEETATPTFEDKEHEIANIAKLNNGQVPYSTNDANGVPNYIDGAFSGKTVKNATDAIASLNDIHHIMKFGNAIQEFKEVYSKESNDTGFYRLQQVYHGVPVYGSQLVVSTDDNGTIQSLTGHYSPEIDVETTPKVSVDEAKATVKRIETSDSETVSQGLYIYEHNGNKFLAWAIKTLVCDYFVDANTGEVINSINTVYDVSGNGTGTDLVGNTVSFPVDYSNGLYSLSDTVRNITTYDSQDIAQSNGILVTNTTNSGWEGNQAAISVYNNMITVFDYYANILGRDGADDLHKRIHLAVNYRKEKDKPWANAAYFRGVTDTTLIRFGNAHNYAQCLDIIAHEYTHAVSSEIINNLHKTTEGLIYLNESGALNEAYSDILGELIQNGRLEKIAEDLDTYANETNADRHCMRNFANPKAHNYPSKFSEHTAYCYKNGHHGCNCGDTKDHNCDNGGVHSNSSIINHAAYKIDQNWPTSSHTDELATLFYKSIWYLSPNSNFLDCRHAVLAAAKSMNMSDDKREVIANAFKDVGIYQENDTQDVEDDTQNVFASGKIIHAFTGDVVENVVIKFRNNSDNTSGDYVQTVDGLDIELKTDSYGKYYTSALSAGNYTLEASKDGFVTSYKNIVSGNSNICTEQNLEITPKPSHTDVLPQMDKSSKDDLFNRFVGPLGILSENKIATMSNKDLVQSVLYVWSDEGFPIENYGGSKQVIGDSTYFRFSKSDFENLFSLMYINKKADLTPFARDSLPSSFSEAFNSKWPGFLCDDQFYLLVPPYSPASTPRYDPKHLYQIGKNAYCAVFEFWYCYDGDQEYNYDNIYSTIVEKNSDGSWSLLKRYEGGYQPTDSELVEFMKQN